jgi:capsule biosynthesis phosphatase
MDSSNAYCIVIDVDGTLCPIKKDNQNYSDLVPFRSVVDALKEYHKQGIKIVIFSSRNMRSYGGDLGLINKNTVPIMLDWLKKWDIPFDEILFGKPWPGYHGFYVDDRSVRPDEFVKYSFSELEEICKKSKENL